MKEMLALIMYSILLFIFSDGYHPGLKGAINMYIQQVELTRGVGRDFVKALRDMSVVEEYAQGDILFRKGDPANHTYLLLIGRVHLKIGEIGHVIHIVSRPGETFGWSSLVKRDVYSSTAECVLETNVRKLHRDDLQKLLVKDPSNGLIFFQHLAGMLGERLLESYASFEKLFPGDTYV